MDFCIVCGDWPADEWDHCPPKCLFPKPRPDDLITAPICSDCHDGTGQDDTYFWIKVAAMEEAGGHPAISEGDVISRAFRGLNRPAAKGLRISYLEDVHPTFIDGVPRTAYHVDLQRVHDVVRRTVRGLHWHEFDDVIDHFRRVQVLAEKESGHMTEPWRKAQPIVEQLEQIDPVVVGNDVFSYRVGRELPSSFTPSQAWLLNYYDGVRFLAVV